MHRVSTADGAVSICPGCYDQVWGEGACDPASFGLPSDDEDSEGSTSADEFTDPWSGKVRKTYGCDPENPFAKHRVRFPRSTEPTPVPEFYVHFKPRTFAGYLFEHLPADWPGPMQHTVIGFGECALNELRIIEQRTIDSGAEAPVLVCVVATWQQEGRLYTIARPGDGDVRPKGNLGPGTDERGMCVFIKVLSSAPPLFFGFGFRVPDSTRTVLYRPGC